MQFLKPDEVEYKRFDLEEPLKVENRKTILVHSDTDSCYLCFEEMKNKWFPNYTTEPQIRQWFGCLEKMMEQYWKDVLNKKAKLAKTQQLIKFNRENMFIDFFDFAKKMYIGRVIDSEGKVYPLAKPKHKIQGVPIKRSDMPEFCKEESEKLAFDICAGITHDEAQGRIYKIFKEFTKSTPDELSAKKSISAYTKYIKNDISWYIKNGLSFQKGWTFAAKVALTYNYVVAVNKLPLSQINNGTKFNFLYVKPSNKYRVDAIAYVGAYPKAFESIFEIDYERAFRKTFMPLFQNMFFISKWIKHPKKDLIPLRESKMSLLW